MKLQRTCPWLAHNLAGETNPQFTGIRVGSPRNHINRQDEVAARVSGCPIHCCLTVMGIGPAWQEHQLCQRWHCHPGSGTSPVLESVPLTPQGMDGHLARLGSLFGTGENWSLLPLHSGIEERKARILFPNLHPLSRSR